MSEAGLPGWSRMPLSSTIGFAAGRRWAGSLLLRNRLDELWVIRQQVCPHQARHQIPPDVVYREDALEDRQGVFYAPGGGHGSRVPEEEFGVALYVGH